MAIIFWLYFHFPLILYPRTRGVAESAAQRSSTTWAMGRVVYGESDSYPGLPRWILLSSGELPLAGPFLLAVLGTCRSRIFCDRLPSII